MKRFKGRMTELDDVVLADCMAYDVTVATVSKDKISLEWVEGDDPFCAVLRSTNGVEYHGHFGCPQLNELWTMKMWRYLAEDGRVLLLTEWLQADEGLGGTCLFGLFPHVTARRDDDRRRTHKTRRIARTRPRRT